MTKLDWQPRDNWPRDDRGTVTSPFIAQGVRDALRNAYSHIGEQMPPDLSSLLNKLR